MFTITKFIGHSRFIVKFVSLAVKVYPQVSISTISIINARNMSQKSITSFFTITPKKPVKVQQKNKDEVRNGYIYLLLFHRLCFG